MRKYSCLYVGVTGICDRRVIFRSAVEPTAQTHGNRFSLVIGPFRTKAGAQYMADYGVNNPYCRCVADAEKLAKLPR